MVSPCFGERAMVCGLDDRDGLFAGFGFFSQALRTSRDRARRIKIVLVKGFEFCACSDGM